MHNTDMGGKIKHIFLDTLNLKFLKTILHHILFCLFFIENDFFTFMIRGCNFNQINVTAYFLLKML